MSDGYQLYVVTGEPFAGRLLMRAGYGTTPASWPYALSVCVEHGALVVGHGNGAITWQTLRHGQWLTIPADSTRIMAALEPVTAYLSGVACPPLSVGRAPVDVMGHADTRPFSAEAYGAGYFDGSQVGAGFRAEHTSYEGQKRETEKKRVRLLDRCDDCTSFLEVGCACGYLVHDLIEAGKDAHGVDISEWAVSNAYGLAAGRVARVELGAEPLPFDSLSVDCVHSWDTVEHIPVWHVQAALDELCRVAAKALVLRTPLRTYRNRCQPHDWSYSDPTGSGADLTHVSCLPEDFWVGECERRGLLNVSVEVWNSKQLKAEGWLWFRRADA